MSGPPCKQPEEVPPVPRATRARTQPSCWAAEGSVHSHGTSPPFLAATGGWRGCQAHQQRPRHPACGEPWWTEQKNHAASTQPTAPLQHHFGMPSVMSISFCRRGAREGTRREPQPSGHLDAVDAHGTGRAGDGHAAATAQTAWAVRCGTRKESNAPHMVGAVLAKGCIGGCIRTPLC